MAEKMLSTEQANVIPTASRIIISYFLVLSNIPPPQNGLHHRFVVLWSLR